MEANLPAISRYSAQTLCWPYKYQAACTARETFELGFILEYIALCLTAVSFAKGNSSTYVA